MKRDKSAGLIVVNENKILLVKNPKNQWLLPKGHLEKDETEEQAAVREIKEETDIDVELIPGFREEDAYWFREKGELVRKEVVFFMAKAKNSNITVDKDELSDANWFDWDAGIDIASFDSVKKLLKRAREFCNTHE